jgi:hypothetical protein
MKTRIIILFISALVLSLGACKEKEPTAVPQPKAGSVTIAVKHHVDGKDLVTESIEYTNEAGNEYAVDVLMHYLSNFELRNTNGNWHKINLYKLVNIKKPSSTTFDLTNIPFGEYDSIRFYLGVDSTTNYAIDNSGDLDPALGLFWPWNTGYIFYMFEGRFKKGQNNFPFAYHIGDMSNLITKQFLLPNVIKINQSSLSQRITLKMELSEIFKSPHTIDLNEVPLVSHTFDQPELTKKLRENIEDMFSIE